jgi:hypothetical protein
VLKGIVNVPLIFLQTSNSRCEQPIKKHKKDESFIEDCFLEHPQAQECFRVLNGTFDVLHFFCRPHLNNTLREEIKKTFKMLLWPCRALDCSQEHSMSDQAFLP